MEMTRRAAIFCIISEKALFSPNIFGHFKENINPRSKTKTYCTEVNALTEATSPKETDF